MKRYLLVLLEAVSAVGALGAAIGSYDAARATRQAMEAQLFSQITHAYAAPDMAQSLQRLRAWAAQYGEGFAEEFRNRFTVEEPDAADVDQARRQVLFHFLTVLRLQEGGYVPEVFVQQAACTGQGLEVLAEIVEPMRLALNPAANRAEFAHLLRLCQYVPRRIGAQSVTEVSRSSEGGSEHLRPPNALSTPTARPVKSSAVAPVRFLAPADTADRFQDALHAPLENADRAKAMVLSRTTLLA
jgi:hypothetical protein